MEKIDKFYYFIKEAMALRGIPDIIFCKKGKFGAIEVKKSEQAAKSNTGRIVLQKYIGSLIQKAGGYFKICYPENLEETIAEIESL